MYISVHKYISITKPFSRVMTPKRILLLIAAAWTWPVICASTPFFGLTDLIYKTGASQCGPALPRELKNYIHSFLINTTNYLIPLGVMTFCYYHIFKAIRDHMDRIRLTSNIDLRNSIEQQKRVTVTLLLVLACFLICWTPYIIYATMANIVKDKSKIPLVMNPVAYWCGYMNSACNPIIYAFRSPSFRHGYMEIIFGRRVVLESGGRLYCASVTEPIFPENIFVRNTLKKGGKLSLVLMTQPERSLPTTPLSRSFSLRSSSFRNRSMSQGNHRASTLTRKIPGSRPRNKRFLSQTSWISLPLIPLPGKRYTTSERQETSSMTGTLRRHKSESQVKNDASPDDEPILHNTRPVSVIMEVPSEEDCGSSLQLSKTAKEENPAHQNGDIARKISLDSEADKADNV